MGMKFLEENLLTLLERPEFAPLKEGLRCRTYAPKGIVFHPHESDDVVFIVAKGRVRIYLAYEDKEFTLGILGEGDIYSSHTSTFVQSLEETELLVMEVSKFRKLMSQLPVISGAMVRVLGNVLKNSFGIIDGLVFHDAHCRLVALLATEARRHGKETADGIVVDIDLPMEQVGRMVGASRQTISTSMNKLIRQGLIKKVARGQYLIPNVDELEDSATDCSF